MKRLIIALLLCFFVAIEVHADVDEWNGLSTETGIDELNGLVLDTDIDEWNNIAISVAVADVCDATTYFQWHAENVDVTLGGPPTGCSDNDETATLAGHAAISAAQKSDGSNSLFLDHDDTAVFDVPTNYNSDSIKITFDLYITNLPDAAYVELIHLDKDTNDNLGFRLNSGSTLTVENETDNTGESVSVNVVVGSWQSCEYQYKDGVAGNDHYLICGASSDEEDDDPRAGDTMTSFQFGDKWGSGTNSDIYLDNIKMGTCDRY